jgi:hypothetical protein
MAPLPFPTGYGTIWRICHFRGCGMAQTRTKAREGQGLGLIRGARPLARFIFDDENEWKKVYPLKDELGLFRLNGLICGRPETILARIAERERRKPDTDAAA